MAWLGETWLDETWLGETWLGETLDETWLGETWLGEGLESRKWQNLELVETRSFSNDSGCNCAQVLSVITRRSRSFGSPDSDSTGAISE